jgi:hypothetical protein
MPGARGARLVMIIVAGVIVLGMMVAMVAAPGAVTPT